MSIFGNRRGPLQNQSGNSRAQVTSMNSNALAKKKAADAAQKQNLFTAAKLAGSGYENREEIGEGWDKTKEWAKDKYTQLTGKAPTGHQADMVEGGMDDLLGEPVSESEFFNQHAGQYDQDLLASTDASPSVAGTIFDNADSAAEAEAARLAAEQAAQTAQATDATVQAGTATTDAASAGSSAAGGASSGTVGGPTAYIGAATDVASGETGRGVGKAIGTAVGTYFGGPWGGAALGAVGGEVGDIVDGSESTPVGPSPDVLSQGTGGGLASNNLSGGYQGASVVGRQGGAAGGTLTQDPELMSLLEDEDERRGMGSSIFG